MRGYVFTVREILVVNTGADLPNNVWIKCPIDTIQPHRTLGKQREQFK